MSHKKEGIINGQWKTIRGKDGLNYNFDERDIKNLKPQQDIDNKKVTFEVERKNKSINIEIQESE